MKACFPYYKQNSDPQEFLDFNFFLKAKMVKDLVKKISCPGSGLELVQL